MVLINLLIKPFWVFGIDRTVQNKLGESAYGLYFAIFNFTYLFQILLDFGLQNYNNRQVAADKNKINELLPAILVFKTLLFVVYLVLCIAVAYPIGYLSKPFIWIILLNQILLSFNIYLRSNVSAHQLFISDAMLSVLDKFLMIIFCGFLIWGNLPFFKLSIFNFALAQLAAYAITFITCLFFSLRLTNKMVFNFNLKNFIVIAKATLPYAVIHFLMTVYYRIDGVMLERLQGANGAAESGIYAQGYRIMESLNNIGYLLATILLPLFAYRIASHKEIKSLLKTGLSLVFCISVSIIVCLFAYKENLMSILYSNGDFNYSGEVFGYLLLNFFPVAILYVIGTLLTANQDFKLMIYTLITAVILNISLNFYLITHYGAKGAGEATLITQLFMLVCYSFYILRIFKISFNIKYALQLFAFLFACVIIMFGIGKINFSVKKGYDLAAHFAIYFCSVPFTAYLTGLINVNTFRLKVGTSE
ncbi:MAG: rane protein involved in the export of O-antigen and teichoic acid [Bacteroidota bacterium]|nr:rane protein involved in the export of O-antigen and teichoic acid [Bacteroidota bacterium]